MDRKKTILIAVLINAALLVVLFITALATREEPITPNPELIVVEEPASPAVFPPAEEPLKMPTAQLPVFSKKEVQTEPPMHKLPTLAEESSSVEPPCVEIAVKKGDSLEKIAKTYHISIDEIIRLNQLPSSFLKVGQTLKIPAAKAIGKAPDLRPHTPQEKKGGPEYYTVKVGDNPWTIAMKHHMKVEELLRLNGLNEEKARKLKPGDRLRIR